MGTKSSTATKDVSDCTTIGAQRIVYIDCLRAFAIFLVTLGHVIEQLGYKDDSLYAFIYSFHMPLFMAISGYVCAYSSAFKGDDIHPVKRFFGFIVQKFRFILIPYFMWALLIDPFFFFTYQHEINWLACFRAACIDNTSLYWFLPCLFGLLVSYGLFDLAIRLTKCKGKPLVACLLFMGLGLLIAGLYYLTEVAFLRSIVSYFIPFWMGALMALFPSFGQTILTSRGLLRICIVGFCLVEGLYVGGTEGIGKMARLICGLCAIPIWFQLFRHLQLPANLCSLLSYVGRHTLVIYTMQIAMLPMFGILSGLSGMLQLIIGSVISVCWIAVILFFAKIVSYDKLLRQILMGLK